MSEKDMMYIDDFNEMTGTRYTKESFIKLFSQYFPNGAKGDQTKYNENYKKMFDHALRFSIRSYVFQNKEINYDVEKVANGLNKLFDEQIDDYNKLMSVKGQNNKSIKYIENGGLSKEEVDKKILSSIDDMPKTIQEEEYKIVLSSAKLGQNPKDIDTFNDLSMERLKVLNSPSVNMDKSEQHSRSIDVIKNMIDMSNTKDRTYRFAHPIKAQEGKRAIENAKEFLESNGYNKGEIEKGIGSPSSPSKVYSLVENNIKDGSTLNIKEESLLDDFHKKLGNNTSFDISKERANKVFKQDNVMEKGINK